MQNPIQNIKQCSIVFEKPGILSGKLKILTNSTSSELHVGVRTRSYSGPHVPAFGLNTESILPKQTIPLLSSTNFT